MTPLSMYVSPRDPTAVLGRRVVAYLIDWGITAFVFLLLFGAMADRIDKRGTEFDGINACPALRGESNVNFCFESPNTAYTLRNGQLAIAIIVPTLVSLANLVALQSATGGSVGKQILGLRVIDGQGNIANVGRTVVRWLFLVVDSFCGVLGLVVAAAATPHRRIGDFAAGTYVVSRNDVGRPPTQPAHDEQVPTPYLTQQYQTASYQTPGYPTGGYQPPQYPAVPYQAPAPASPPAPPSTPSAPVWDAQRGAWVSYDPARAAWLRYDDTTREWRDL